MILSFLNIYLFENESTLFEKLESISNVLLGFSTFGLTLWIFFNTRKFENNKELKNHKLDLFKSVIIENKISDFFTFYDNLIQKINENKDLDLLDEEKSDITEYFNIEAKVYRQKFYDLLLSINLNTYNDIKYFSDELIDFLTEKLFDSEINYLSSNYISNLEDEILDSRKKSLKKIFTLINRKNF